MKAAVTLHRTRQAACAGAGTNEIASAVAAKLNHAASRSYYAMTPSRGDPAGMAFHDVLFVEMRDLDGVIGSRAESITRCRADSP